MPSVPQVSGSSAEINGCKNTGHKCQLVLENLYDSYNGYKACADDCKDLQVKIHFENIAMNRSHFIDQLAGVLKTDFDLEPVTSGTGLEAAHEAWINIKAWFNDGLDKATIFTEVHRCEAHLIDHYIMALSQPEHLTDKVWRVLQEQLKTIKEQDAALYSL